MLSHCAGAVDQSRMNEQKRALFENIISTIKGPHCHLLFSYYAAALSAKQRKLKNSLEPLVTETKI